jgi:hypothetical protein
MIGVVVSTPVNTVEFPAPKIELPSVVTVISPSPPLAILYHVQNAPLDDVPESIFVHPLPEGVGVVDVQKPPTVRSISALAGMLGGVEITIVFVLVSRTPVAEPKYAIATTTPLSSALRNPYVDRLVVRAPVARHNSIGNSVYVTGRTTG